MHINKNPYLNALFAGLYIGLVGFGLNRTSGMEGVEGTIFVPLFMLSFFVFSAAVMAYLFVAEPVMLYADGKRTEAVSFFLKTLGAFALWLIVFGALALAHERRAGGALSGADAKVNVEEVCRGALAYMSFPSSAEADAFVGACMNGERPEVIEKYKRDMGLGGGAAI